MNRNRETDLIAHLMANTIQDETVFDPAAILAIADNLMTPVQVAEYYGVPKSNVQGYYRRRTNNLIIAQNTDGRSPQFYRPQVLEWAAKNRNKVGWDAPVQEDLK